MPASFEAWKAAFPGAFISQPLEKDKSADGDNDNIDEDEDEYQVSMYSEDERVKTSSDRFCMLPTDFQVDKDGTTTIESYINNLHPVQYQKLYPVICKLFSKFLPAVEQVLTDMVYSRPRRIDTSRRWCDDDRTEYDSDLDDYRDDYASDDMSDERMAAWVKNKQYIGLEPEKFVAPERPLKPYSLRGRRLQAIVKMTNIELTPDNPVFYQKSWNIVGTVNERVIATGVYCYDMENIDHVYKQFREPMYGMHVYFRCFDGIGLYMMYGIERGENGDPLPASQPVGQIQIKKGRYFAFPNTYQYRDTEFKLKDPSKPGFCK
ncbi:hypothetical protein GGI07_003892 [Coemansia sp. Benny D115]|nr:hypothetical protein GGI07_003892 [Coemansia sp. Benny D115]